MRILARATLAIAILLVTGWAALALRLGPFRAEDWSAAFAALGGTGAVSAFVPRLRRIVLPAYGIALAGFAYAWTQVEPSNDRDWQADVAVLSYATLDGERVTIHNVRNFDYRTETDFTPRYYDKTYDLAELDS